VGKIDCLDWAGYISPEGYGSFTAILEEVQAHRISYTLTFGPIPEGKEIDHLCRNRRCINPFHLEAVTRKINSRRGAKAKLSFESADAIRNSTAPTRDLMRIYGVSRCAIKAVRRGASWN
jgi:hypothetical protein